MTRLGERFKELRGETSIRQVASELGLHSGIISRYELGKTVPSSERMQKLAEYFHVSYEELYDLYHYDLVEKFLTNSEMIHYALRWISEKVEDPKDKMILDEIADKFQLPV